MKSGTEVVKDEDELLCKQALSLMKIVIVIPARLDSSRLKRKMLVDLEGEPLIVRTFQRALQARCADRVVVATDSSEIASVLGAFGAEVVMTGCARCGSERIAEAAGKMEGDVFINLQGDEPLIDPGNIDRVAEPYLQGENPDCVTLIYPVLPTDYTTISDRHVVKTVVDKNGYALYFSRSQIPFQQARNASTIFYRHIGIYAFRKDVLSAFSALGPSMLEQEESLEQLRLLENGYRIRCVETTVDSPGVNTFEELEFARRMFREQNRPV